MTLSREKTMSFFGSLLSLGELWEIVAAYSHVYST